MPRLPTIRVIGSQAISTSSVFTAVMAYLSSPGPGRAGGELLARPAPARLLVEGLGGDVAQPLDGPAVRADHLGGQLAAGRLVHERHELVREARHGAADADATDVRAAAHPVDPAAF